MVVAADAVVVVGGQLSNCEAGAGGIAGRDNCCSKELTKPKLGALKPKPVVRDETEVVAAAAPELCGLLEFCNNCLSSTCCESSDLGTVVVTFDDLQPLANDALSPAFNPVDDETVLLSLSVPSTGSIFTLDSSKLNRLVA